MSEYRIYLDDELLSKTEWPPIAQAAWSRASRDRDAAQHGGHVVILKDGVELCAGRPRTAEGLLWPDSATPEAGPREVAAAIQQLARAAGVSAHELADQLTLTGLPTTPARLKSMTTLQSGRRTFVADAELVALCYAAVGVIKGRS